MRISDWSSDVCSSDLQRTPQGRSRASWASGRSRPSVLVFPVLVTLVASTRAPVPLAVVVLVVAAHYSSSPFRVSSSSSSSRTMFSSFSSLMPVLHYIDQLVQIVPALLEVFQGGPLVTRTKQTGRAAG